ncbi:tagaturonate reductase [Empedobacter falsenii]
MKTKLNKKLYHQENELPIKIIQFGGGNFMRAFTDYVIDKLNKDANFNAGIANIKVTPSGSSFHTFEEQDNLYTLFIRGIKKGELIDENRVISAIQKSINPYKEYQDFLNLAKEEQLEFVFSNTTESGIVFDPSEDKLENAPHENFPAKLTAFLYERYLYFDGNSDKGLTIIPCELIENNAIILKDYILEYAKLWNLENEFITWINTSNNFHNTLVDRIVPGFPKDDLENYANQLNYEDELIVVSEAFLFWAIEGDEKLDEKIPFSKANEQILLVENIAPYRTSKVRILNGAHTSMVPFSIMLGIETVRNAIDNKVAGDFIKNIIYNEIIPILDLPEEQLKEYTEDVLDRFRNPFIKHYLSSIALNSISKFKVRVLPSLLDYVEKFNQIPKGITFSLACLIRFYKGDWNNQKLPVNDDEAIINEFRNIWKNNDYQQISHSVLKNINFWEQDLTKVNQLENEVEKALRLIDEYGIEKSYEMYSNQTI